MKHETALQQTKNKWSAKPFLQNEAGEKHLSKENEDGGRGPRTSVVLWRNETLYIPIETQMRQEGGRLGSCMAISLGGGEAGTGDWRFLGV